MTNNLTEEEMRQALFGSAASAEPVRFEPELQNLPAAIIRPLASRANPKAFRRFIPRLRVTLRVGNDFEGETELIVHEADTMSSLQAEQDATKAARKKFRYVELVSVKPVS
ncbi:hypothetical protein ALP94_01034 [Pseudomonas savastanoi pv. glycinea]|nr:hypothetical protein ALP94_01034 [Pseudomonas savastanoi pv. glycinea]RZI60219.1 MAG: hypothetical protein EOP14_02145 [Pseudomonas sp.]